jgi:hypothetical protein
VLFLSWISLSINATLRILREFQQTMKLGLYLQLTHVIVGFVGLFVAVSLLFLLNERGVIELPWRLDLLQQCVWETVSE